MSILQTTLKSIPSRNLTNVITAGRLVVAGVFVLPALIADASSALVGANMGIVKNMFDWAFEPRVARFEAIRSEKIQDIAVANARAERRRQIAEEQIRADRAAKKTARRELMAKKSFNTHPNTQNLGLSLTDEKRFQGLNLQNVHDADRIRAKIDEKRVGIGTTDVDHEDKHRNNEPG